MGNMIRNTSRALRQTGRGLNALRWLLGLSLGLSFASIVGDAPSRVSKGEPGYAQASQWASAIAWGSAFPFLAWMWAAASGNPVTFAAPALVAIFGLFLFGRRLSAHAGIPMGPIQLVKRINTMAFPERDRNAAGELDARPFNAWATLLSAGAALMTVAVVLMIDGVWAPILQPADAAMVAAAAQWAEALLYGGYTLWLVVAACAGRLHAEYSTSEGNIVEFLGSRVAASAGISYNSFLASGAEIRVSPSENRITLKPVPDSVQRDLKALESGLAIHLPEYTCHGQTLTIDEIVMVKIDTLDPAAQAEVRGAREASRLSEGLVLANLGPTPADPVPGGNRRVRPEAQLWKLSPGARPALVDAFARESTGHVLVEFNDATHRATVARLSTETLAIRARLAQLLKASEWDIELHLTRVPDSAGAGTRIDTVEILRSPSLGVDQAKRIELLRLLIQAIPGGSSGWKIEEDAVTGRALLTYGEPRILPGLVPMSQILPSTAAPDDWATLPLGIDPDGAQAQIDLRFGPHSLVVGPTGSGKTILVIALVTQALMRGHQIVLIDPTKAGLDFLTLRPWISAWADTLVSAQATIEHVYGEVTRRKGILQREGQVKWSDLSPEVRERENVHPVLCVIDEFGSLVIPEDIPKTLDRSHPFAVEAGERNTARAILSATVGRLAREARFAGIHLVIALQRPDANIVGGELRSNLTSAVQLSAPGKLPSMEALRMVFPGELAPVAAEALTELDDGRSHGLAVVAAEGGSAKGFRVAYAPAAAVPAVLEDRGIAPARPWTIGASSTADEQPPVRRRAEPQAAPQIIDLGEFEFTLDDLDDEPAGDAEPGPDFTFDFETPASALLPAPEVPSTTSIL